MNTVEIQIASNSEKIPKPEQFQDWVDSALKTKQKHEVVIRIVDEDEMCQFNQQYRNKSGLTNILSFPAELPEICNSALLGDLLICAPVVENEAKQQQKPLVNHWAHLTIHGLLHLTGHDHIIEAEAEKMETLEIQILSSLHIQNPYKPEP